jgi:putative FmdB family regulatory protein
MGLDQLATGPHHVISAFGAFGARRSCRPDDGTVEGRRLIMPTYEFRCKKCKGHFEKVMTVAQREKARPVCPGCKSRSVEPILGGFFAKTSRKS